MKKIILIIMLIESVMLIGQTITIKSKSIILRPIRNAEISQIISFTNLDIKDNATIKLSANEIDLSGKINEGNEIKSLFINDTRMDIGGNLSFVEKITLNEGENQITVKTIGQNDLVQEINFLVIYELSPQRTDYALLFATDIYDSFPNLANPVFDAETIEGELKENYNFETHLVKNPGKDTILAKLRVFASKNYSKEDQLMIFFAGHGIFDDIFNVGYLMAADTKSDDEVKSSYLSHPYLQEIVNNIPCEHILLVIDACFSGTFDQIIAYSRGGDETDRINEEWIKKKLRLKTRKYITSGGKEYVSDGKKGHHSPFARRILKALRNYGGSDGVLTLAELLVYLEGMEPDPRSSEFGDNQPGSSFLFIYK